MSDAKKPGYMLIFRSDDWYKQLSPQQIQEVADQWMIWFKRLAEQGAVSSGRPLEHSGKIVSGKAGRVITDGPFVETKETIGGYFLLQADSLEEAVTIARECPGLLYGVRVEVRPIAPSCPIVTDAQLETQLAHV